MPMGSVSRTKTVIGLIAVLGIAAFAFIHQNEALDKVRRKLGGGNGKTWQVFSPTGGGFSVDMPDVPTCLVQPKTEWGIEYHILYYSATDHAMTFSVSHYDRPDALFVDWSPEALIAAIGGNVEARHESDFVQKERTIVGGKPAMLYNVSQNDEFIRYLLLPTDSRCYLLLISGRRVHWSESLAERFLRSFKLTEVEKEGP